MRGYGFGVISETSSLFLEPKPAADPNSFRVIPTAYVTGWKRFAIAKAKRYRRVDRQGEEISPRAKRCKIAKAMRYRRVGYKKRLEIAKAYL